MTSALEIFSYKNQQVRTVNHNGEVWFVAKDVCDILELTNAREAIRSLDDDERSTVRISDGTSPKGGNPNVNIISETGVYALAFRSNKPEAKKFARWVRKDVLPQIRKYGMYLSDKVFELYQNDPQIFEKLLASYAENVSLKERVQKLEEQVSRDQSFTTLGKVVYALPGAFPFKDGADLMAQHNLPIGQNRLFKLARDLNLLCSRKGKQWNKPTQYGLRKGYVCVEVSGGFKTQTMMTPKGLKFFTDLLVKENYPLLALIEE